MTQHEAKLIRSLHVDRLNDGRVILNTYHRKQAARSLESHGLIRYIEANSPDSSKRGVEVQCDEAEWEGKWA